MIPPIVRPEAGSSCARRWVVFSLTSRHAATSRAVRCSEAGRGGGGVRRLARHGGASIRRHGIPRLRRLVSVQYSGARMPEACDRHPAPRRVHCLARSQELLDCRAADLRVVRDDMITAPAELFAASADLTLQRVQDVF